MKKINQFISVFKVKTTSYTLSALITIRSCITSFAYLRISAVIITDNVQRNLSRGVFKLYLRIMYNAIYLGVFKLYLRIMYNVIYLGVFKLYLRIMYNAIYVGVFKLYLLQVDYYRENFVSRQSWASKPVYNIYVCMLSAGQFLNKK